MDLCSTRALGTAYDLARRAPPRPSRPTTSTTIPDAHRRGPLQGPGPTATRYAIDSDDRNHSWSIVQDAG